MSFSVLHGIDSASLSYIWADQAMSYVALSCKVFSVDKISGSEAREMGYLHWDHDSEFDPRI